MGKKSKNPSTAAHDISQIPGNASGPDPRGRPLTASELELFRTMPPNANGNLEKMLSLFGRTVDELRIDPCSQALLYPIDVQIALDAAKEGRLDAFSSMTPQFLGMTAVVHNLSETTLNHKAFTIVKIFPDEDKVAIDATPPEWPPERVRYIKISTSMISTMHYEQNHDGLNFNIVICNNGVHS